MFCEHPWKALRHDKIDLQNIILKGNRPKISVDDERSTEIPKDLISLIKESWSAKPEDRPSISSIKDRLYKILEPEVVSKKYKSPSHELALERIKEKDTSASNQVTIEMSTIESSTSKVDDDDDDDDDDENRGSSTTTIGNDIFDASSTQQEGGTFSH